MSFIFETNHAKLEIAENARVTGFFDKTSGKNVVKEDTFFGKMVLSDRSEILPCRIDYIGDKLTFFYENGNKVYVKATAFDNYLKFEYSGADNEDFRCVTFVNIEVETDYSKDISFVASGMGLTVNTHMAQYPGRNTKLAGTAYTHVGTKGAAFAVIGAPEKVLNPIMREIVNNIPDGVVPKGKYNGPFAGDCPYVNADYVIRVEPLTEENLDAYIDTLKDFCVTQVNFHQAKMYRQGDFSVSEQYYPNGRKDFKKIIDKLHANGIKSALHSYAFFIDPYGAYQSKGSRYLCPVPSEDLAVYATFTLARDVGADDTYIKVTEVLDPKSKGFVFGFAEKASPVLRLDDELVYIKSVDEHGFTVERSAFKTANRPHKGGVEVRQLGAYFTHLMPKKKSKLFYEVAKNTADFYNECDFDGFYIDAIDGSLALDTDEFSWYHAVEFVNELFKHLKKPPIFNCCYGPQYPGHWFARTLMGAFDTPGAGYRNFTDVHIDFNAKFAESMYFVSELGWWRLFPLGHLLNYQKKIMWPEDVEYLMCKMLATDAVMCWLSSFEAYKEYPILQSYLPIIKKYTTLRNEKYFSKEIKQKLRAPQTEYHLLEENGGYTFVQMYTDMQKLDTLKDGRNTLTYKNRFNTQSPTVRIEALYTAGDYCDEKAVTLLKTDENKDIGLNRVYPVDNSDANGNRALGFWLYGDGKGETVCIRLHCKKNISNGVADYFVKVDFTGWRYFAKRELENSERKPDEFPVQWLEYRVFEDTLPFYGLYDSDISMKNLEKCEIISYPQGEYNIKLRDIKALPEAALTLKNPAITVGDTKITFNVELKSGEYIEYNPKTKQCVYANLEGRVQGEVTATGEIVLEKGDNTVIFNAGCENENARAAVTLITYGEKI